MTQRTSQLFSRVRFAALAYNFFGRPLVKIRIWRFVLLLLAAAAFATALAQEYKSISSVHAPASARSTASGSRVHESSNERSTSDNPGDRTLKNQRVMHPGRKKPRTSPQRLSLPSPLPPSPAPPPRPRRRIGHPSRPLRPRRLRPHPRPVPRRRTRARRSSPPPRPSASASIRGCRGFPTVTPEAGATAVLGGCSEQQTALVQEVEAMLATLPADHKVNGSCHF
jgi:hypothetical protein